MSLSKIKRRDFLKVMGWSGAGVTLAACDMPTTVTLEEGKEDIVSYFAPEEYVIPGIGVWFASTCQQCSAGCGVHGRVREGRVLKLEGNPDSEINSGRLCQMGQAGLQTHYNPDRITKPLMKKGGSYSEVSWDEAMDVLNKKVGSSSGLGVNKMAWVTGTMSGHQSVLLSAFMKSSGSRQHYATEVINNAVWQRVCRDMLGDSNPRLRLDKAQTIISFGADFLGTWASPVHYARQYADFRTSPRGTLVQIEPKMTLTGANADQWMAIKPGTEGAFALGLANVLINRYRVRSSVVPADVMAVINRYNPDKVTSETGISSDQLMKVAEMLKNSKHSLVLAGASAEGQQHGYQAVAAAMLLNIILGNVGKTIQGSARMPSQLSPVFGNTSDMVRFANSARKGKIDVAFFYGTNPLFTAPESLGLKDGLDKIGFKVAISSFKDETTMQADLILPLASSIEDWGTHVAGVQGAKAQIAVQQPLMEKIYPETKGFGDIMLAMLKLRKVSGYAGFDDYYAYLRNAVGAMPATMKSGSDDAWQAALQTGVIGVSSSRGALQNNIVKINIPDSNTDSAYPYTLIPSARMGLWDGRHANLPWLQEAPDQISKVVWDSWVEMHPKTAARLGVKRGDFVKIASKEGAIEAKVYIFKGIHPDAIAVPMGQGHKDYGRYAKGVGVNPMSIVSASQDKKTGEIAHHATTVQVTRVGDASYDDQLVIMGGSDTQVGRKLAATVTADVFERTEGDA